MADRAPSNIGFQHVPTMLIRTDSTQLAKTDPLKKIFRSLFEYLPSHSRGHVVAALGEFIGTMIWIFMAFSAAQVAFISSNSTKKGNIDTSIKEVSPQELLFIALGVGFSLAVAAWIFFRISGGLFNPVISIGMGLIGALTWTRVAVLCLVQTIATIVAAYMVSGIFPGELNVGTTLHPSVSITQGVIIEMLLTAQLVFTVFMLAAEKHDATFIAPIGIGLSGFIAELIGVFFTGGSLNPARSLAPAIVTRDFPTYHWIYWLGPLAGAVLAVLLYKLIKALEYETAQDDDEEIHDTLPTKQSKPKKNPDNGAIALSNGKTDLESAPQHLLSSHLAPPQPTYAKVPFVQDKESENERRPSVLTPMANKDGGVDIDMFKAPPLSRTGTEYGGYSAGHYCTKLPDNTMDFQCKGLPDIPEHQPNILPATRTDTEQSTAYYSARSMVSTVDTLLKRQVRARVPTDEPLEEAKRGVTWAV